MPRPQKFWHVYVKLLGAKGSDYAVANDLELTDLETRIVAPWHAGSAFPVSGKIVMARDKVEEIKITQTPEPKRTYSERHYARQRASNVIDMATDTRLLPIREGTDHTHELLFENLSGHAPEPEVGIVLTLCQRIHLAARILATRDRGKPPYQIVDEYDVQDLLHAVIRAYLKYSVHEEPLGNVGGGKAVAPMSRLTISER